MDWIALWWIGSMDFMMVGKCWNLDYKEQKFVQAWYFNSFEEKLILLLMLNA
jgi:hypothetical protein